MRKLFLLIFCCFFTPAIYAQGTFNVSTCAFQDVNAAINNTVPLTGGSPQHLAVDGDIIVLPLCTNTTVSTLCPSNSNTWGCNDGTHDQFLSINVALTLKGQDSPGGNQGGTRKTVIIDKNTKTGNPHPVIYFQPTSPTSVPRITGITFWTATADAGANIAHISVSGSFHAFRIDHNEFDADAYAGGTCTNAGGGSPASQGILLDGDIWGVIDHNLFQFCRVKGTFAFGKGFGSPTATNGDLNWSLAESMGMPGFPANQYNAATGTCGGVGPVPCQAAIIWEDDTYQEDINNTGGNAMACEQSGRCVIRFSSLASQGTHGYEQVAQGQRQWEVYGDTFKPSTVVACSGGSCGAFAPMDIRSGLGLHFENVLDNRGTTYTYSTAVAQEDYRFNACVAGCIAVPNAPWGSLCNGATAPGYSSGSWDYVVGFPGTNPAPTPCIGQPGRGQGNLINRAATTAVWPNQKLLGNYAWKNQLNGVLDPSNSVIDGGKGGNPVQYQANLDYYAGNSSFNGTSGVGYGTIAQIPSSCTVNGPSQDGQFTGVGYWATDQGNWNQSGKKFWDNTSQGILYKCFTNTQKLALPGTPTCQPQLASGNWWCQWYEPFTYPHPLVSGTPSAIATFSPSPVNFGNVNIGCNTLIPPNCTKVNVTLTNTGTTTLTWVGSVTGAPFAIVTGTTCGSPGGSLAAGSSCIWVLQVLPGTVLGQFNGTFSITGDNTSNGTDSVPLTAVIFSIAPNTPSFAGGIQVSKEEWDAKVVYPSYTRPTFYRPDWHIRMGTESIADSVPDHGDSRLHW